MSFKEKMLNDYLFPSINGGEYIPRIVGTVLGTDERNNSCSVRYKDKKNQSVVRYDVPVRLTSVSVIDWFPKVGDQVVMEANNINPIIVGEFEFQSKVTNKAITTLDSDVYSDNMSCETEGGHIY